MTELPLTNEVNPLADPDAVWAWPDGHLHYEPPTVAQLFRDPPSPGHWIDDPETEACGATASFHEHAADGQERRFRCDRPKGHSPDDGHRCVTDTVQGDAVVWTGPGANVVGLPPWLRR